MIEALLPSNVTVVEKHELVSDFSLHAEEVSALGEANSKRREEFTTARACAREALERIGFPNIAVPAGPKGEPIWPHGVTGSITHCEGFYACALARSSAPLAIGIDTEINQPLPAGVLHDVADNREAGRMNSLSQMLPSVSWDRVLFSAKESVYKAWFPLANAWLGFEDAAVTIDPTENTFRARLLVQGPSIDGTPVRGFKGRWSANEHFIATAVSEWT
ncbi:MAG: 4'-phosphopantetheinyl transferase family protein [Chthoniobacterales bacterium]